MTNTKKIQILLSCSLPLALSAVGQTVSYPNGNPGDWTDYVTSLPATTAVGPAGPAGGPSTIVHNDDNAYQAGYGSGPYSYFGGGISTTQPFFQSIAVYINANWAPAAIAGEPSFWIDMSPNQPSDYAAENSFNFYATGSGVNVGLTGQTPSLDITQSGWYDFQMLYAPSTTVPGELQTTLSVYNFDGSGNLGTDLDSQTFADNGPDNVTGSGYVWLPVWQNGFAGDQLDVADVEASTVPDQASTLTLLAAGFGGLAALRRRFARA